MNLGLPVLWIGYLTCIIVLDSFLGMRGYNSYRSPYYRNFGYNNMGGYLGSYLNRRYNYWHLKQVNSIFFSIFFAVQTIGICDAKCFFFFLKLFSYLIKEYQLLRYKSNYAFFSFHWCTFRDFSWCLFVNS